MGYVIRHSTGSINRARKKGNVAFGVSSKGYSKTSISGLYNGVPPVAGKHNLVRVSSTDDPDFYSLSNSELINFANQLGGSVSSTSAAKSYLNGRTDIMFTDNIPDDTETDSLILDLDSTNLASYPGSGNTWYDLSGNGNNTNCSTFNYNGQYFYSVGSSPGQLVFSTSHTTTINDTFIVTSSGWTIEELIRIDDTTYPESSAGTVVSGRAYGSTHTGFDWQHGSMQLSQLNVDMSNKDTGGSNVRDAEVNLSIDSQFQTYGRWILRSIYWDRDNDTCGVYYNGIFQDSGSISGVSGYPLYDGGGISWGTLYGWQHDGARAAMRIYNKVLSESEVKQNHYGGNIVTDSLDLVYDAGHLTSYESGSSTTYPMIGSITGSLVNGASFSNNGGGSFIFDGSDDIIDLDYTNVMYNTSTMTLECWIKSSDDGAGSEQWCTFMGTRYGNSIQIGRYANSNKCGVLIATSTNGNLNLATGTTPIFDEKWHHCVVTFDNGVCKFYVDTNLEVTDSSRSGQTLTTSNSKKFGIGGSSGGSDNRNFYGNITSCKIYSKALSSEEILQNYNAQKARFI